jgi:hypothetical protein
MLDVEKIINDFGKVQEEVSGRILTHYPALKFPESLLPYKKYEIASAFEKMIKIKQNDQETVDVLKAGLTFLDGFINDREAYNLNHQLLAQDSYWEAIHEK